MKLNAITLNNDLSLFFIYFFIVLENQNVGTGSHKLEKFRRKVLQEAGETDTKTYESLSPQMQVQQSVLYKVVSTMIKKTVCEYCNVFFSRCTICDIRVQYYSCVDN